MIDFEKLRKDLKDYCGTAIFNGLPMAVVNVNQVERASNQELIDVARKLKIDLERYGTEQ